jgi:two-component system heavy metal sensor histidine kinase CusS
MSSKNGEASKPLRALPGPVRAWSLAARLTAWYAGSAFALVLAATGFLYWASVHNLDLQDDRVLADRVRELRAEMVNRSGDRAALHHEVEVEWEATRVHMRIMDEAGQILVETPGMDKVLPPSSFPAATGEPERGIDIESPLGGPYRVVAVHATDGRPKRSSYVIQVAMDRTLQTELHAAYRKNLVLVPGTALLICAFAGYQIARRGIRPIHDITQTAQRIRHTNLGERITPDGLPAELLVLAATFNQMLDRLEQSFGRLSRFSADIAHELRTPVHGLRGEIEVALSRPRSLDEYREILASNLEMCGRLAHLIDRMLFLARAENPQTQIAREPCDMRRELEKVCEFYGLVAVDAGVRLGVKVESQVQAEVDRALFQRAVGNLVANALAHTPRGGAVILTATGNEAATRVEVIDNGCGMAAVHLAHVFDRFYRADHTRPSQNGGMGLGLAIVRTIAELHGGTVDLASEVGHGTRVTMIFPRR